MFAAQLEGVDLDAPRAKRHKTTAGSPVVAVKEEGAATNGTGALSGSAGPAGAAQEDPAAVKEKGLKLWQAIKDAVNKECVTLFLSFMLQRASHLRILFILRPPSTRSTPLGLALLTLTIATSPLAS